MSEEANTEPNTEQTVPVAGHWLVSLAQLDDQQKYIAGLRPEVSYMVEGCAGSGKSVLSMIKFNQLVQSGKKPVYATMMRGLTDTIICEMLQNGDESMRSAREYIQKRTKRREAKGGTGCPWYFDSTCIGTLHQMPEVNENARMKLSGDSLVLDECQDLAYDDFKKIAAAIYSPICWYGDDDQQLCDNLGGAKKHVRLHEIFDKCFKAEDDGEKWFKLSWNYRISPNVAKFIDEFQKVVPGERKPMALFAKGKSTDKPYLCGYQTLNDEIASVVEVIKNRGWNNRDGHTTAILVGGSNQQVEGMYQNILQSLEKAVGERNANIERRHGATTRGGNDWVTADPGAAIVVSTPLASKGCQFDSVFVLANTFGLKDGHALSLNDMNAIHVAMTRSGGELFVFYVDKIPPAFDQIPLDLYESSVNAVPDDSDSMGLK